MEKEKIIEILEEWNFWRRERETGIYRDLYVSKILKFVKTDKVISIVGIRRAGKSYILNQVAKRLMESGINKENIVIVNFEEPEFENMDVKFLKKIYESYLEFIKPKGKPFIFLDEIQEVKKWERYVRSLNERKEAFILITGSSSKLLSEELATVLAGRQLYFEIFPLSFKEFLFFKGLKIENLKDVVLNSRKIKALFFEYLKFGGFPEVVLGSDEEFKLRTLRSYFDDILTRDVIRRFKVKEIEKLRTLVKFYLTNISSLITFNKISKFLNLPTETVRRYTSFIETSKAIFFIKRFSYSLKEQENSPRKVYSIDVGLSNVIGFRFTENFGRLAENIVAIELIRKHSLNPNLEIYYFKDCQGRETDFVLKNDTEIKQLIQVCWDISDFGTKEREIKGLLKGMKEFGLKEGLIITEDLEREEKIGDKKIIYMPLWKWILSQELN